MIMFMFSTSFILQKRTENLNVTEWGEITIFFNTSYSGISSNTYCMIFKEEFTALFAQESRWFFRENLVNLDKSFWNKYDVIVGKFLH